MLGILLKLLLILQFTVMAAVPCRCVIGQMRSAEQAAAAECCRGGVCRVAAARAVENTSPSADETRLCSGPQRKSACPGRLLPEVAPPPAPPGDDLPPLLIRSIDCGCVAEVGGEVLAARSAYPPDRADCKAHVADRSLLRQHCALII